MLYKSCARLHDFCIVLTSALSNILLFPSLARRGSNVPAALTPAIYLEHRTHLPELQPEAEEVQHSDGDAALLF